MGVFVDTDALRWAADRIRIIPSGTARSMAPSDTSNPASELSTELFTALNSVLPAVGKFQQAEQDGIQTTSQVMLYLADHFDEFDRQGAAGLTLQFPGATVG